jgi:hypothetical protein
MQACCPTEEASGSAIIEIVDHSFQQLDSLLLLLHEFADPMCSYEIQIQHDHFARGIGRRFLQLLIFVLCFELGTRKVRTFSTYFESLLLDATSYVGT